MMDNVHIFSTVVIVGVAVFIAVIITMFYIMNARYIEIKQKTINNLNKDLERIGQSYDELLDYIESRILSNRKLVEPTNKIYSAIIDRWNDLDMRDNKIPIHVVGLNEILWRGFDLNIHNLIELDKMGFIEDV